MSLAPPDNPSISDRAWLFLQARFSCGFALLCLFGGFVCAAGIGRGDWRLTLVGAVLMLPYALPATLFLVQFSFALLFFAALSLWAWHIKPFLQKWGAK